MAPYDDPKIAVSIIVENGGHGGSDAAPVAQAVIDTYLAKIIPKTADGKMVPEGLIQEPHLEEAD